jgi:pyruvate/2-oxoglutarate dehydrogenase complex dihydrolipoamide dehydrogenase (E3) component
MREHRELVIIGAGPAGMAAAATAAAHGLEPLLIDEQPEPGGQIYRAIGSTPLQDRQLLGSDYWYGKQLTSILRDARIDYRPGHVVWQLTKNREIGILAHEKTFFLEANHIILATGAQERPFPIHGWTLPGVMGAGAAQILLKASGIVPESPVVLAGSGPLLYLVAVQYQRVGVPIAALLETTPRANHRRAFSYWSGALRGFRYLQKGLSLLREIKRGGVRHVTRVNALYAEGERQLERVYWKTWDAPDRWQSLASNTLLLHQGVIPNIQITRALGVKHDWDEQQLCWRPQLNEWGECDVAGIHVAGDGGGIGGAKAAEISGRISALNVLESLGYIDAQRRDQEAAPLRRQRNREAAVRPFLDALYRPAEQWRQPADDIVV